MLKVEKIRDLNLPGTPWATSASRGIPLPHFTLLDILDKDVANIISKLVV
jgi:hypothetical protein